MTYEFVLFITSHNFKLLCFENVLCVNIYSYVIPDETVNNYTTLYKYTYRSKPDLYYNDHCNGI